MGSDTVSATVDLSAGDSHELVVELVNDKAAVAGFALSAQRPAIDDELGRAVSAAAAADVAVVVVGSNSQWESEGEDRRHLSLVGAQDDLIRRVAAANPNTVVVVNAGAPVVMPWADDVAAIVMLWYPGEEGAAALADIVTGLADPGGRLPITFPRRLEDVAAHDWYPGSEGKVVYGEAGFVGYRHADAEDIDPLWCFGHGLSFTDIEVGAPDVERSGAGVAVAVEVSNVGTRAGTEVVQVYVGRTDPTVPRPVRELRGFAKVALEPGETASVSIPLDPRSFSYWDEGAHGWTVDPGTWNIEVGRSSRQVLHRTTLTIA
jgi:beta-glucosidase